MLATIMSAEVYKVYRPRLNSPKRDCKQGDQGFGLGFGVRLKIRAVFGTGTLNLPRVY